MEFNQKVILVTGACSGIGKIMSRKVLERGASVLIAVDINREGLGKLVAEWQQYSSRMHTYQLDLSDAEQIHATAKTILSVHHSVDVLINNAGIVAGKYFHDLKHEEITRILNINSAALMHLTLALLPSMMKRNTGWICNIASMAGLIANPKMSVYAASKWAAVGWSESLRLEMRQLHKKIGVTTIMPYYINTGMFEGVRSSLIPILKPEKAAEKIIRAVEREKALYALPLPYWFIRLSQGLLPLRAFDWVMQHIFGAYDTMKDFIGRQK